MSPEKKRSWLWFVLEWILAPIYCHAVSRLLGDRFVSMQPPQTAKKFATLGLFEQVWSEGNLWEAWARVRQNGGAAGIDGRQIGDVLPVIHDELALLSSQLRAGTYRPQAGLCHEVPKPGATDKRRRLILSTVRDRIVQTAVAQVLARRFEPGFADISFGYREGRGPHEAVKRLRKLLRQQSFDWVVDLDFEKFFDTIPHRLLLRRLSKVLRDRALVQLITHLLCARILHPRARGRKKWVRPRRGVSQGSPLSPVLSNFFLTPLDRQLTQNTSIAPLRYADDIVVLCPDQASAEAALSGIEAFARRNGLKVNQEKTRIADLSREPVVFLGYSFDLRELRPSEESAGRLLFGIEAELSSETAIEEPDAAMESVAAKERGWFDYYRHSDERATDAIRQRLQKRLDSYRKK